jgi:3-isopropylmalate/(R)-2-methylmalate dehydratase small subunit
VLFHDLRRLADGTEDPAFVLNRPAYREARILVAAENFGCGSSREAAVWALAEAGFRAVVAPSFGDIFAENCGKNGLLAAVVPAESAEALRRALHAHPGAALVVDLEAQTVHGPDGVRHRFAVDPFRRACLLRGLDELGLALGHEADIRAYEARRAVDTPWLEPRRPG